MFRTVIIYAFFIWLALAGLSYLSARNLRLGPAAAVASAPIEEFAGEGAISYFREGDGHIDPYLIYRQADGSVATKILSLRTAAASASLAAAVGAGPVAATGTINNEELETESVRRVTGSVPGIAVLTVAEDASATAFSRTFTPLAVIPAGLELTISSASSSESLVLPPGALVDSHDTLFLAWDATLGEDGTFVIVAAQKKP